MKTIVFDERAIRQLGRPPKSLVGSEEVRRRRKYSKELNNLPKREAIMRAATLLFRKLGYPGTPIREIFKVLDVPQSALYYYFDSKEDLLFEILQEASTTLVEGLEEVAKRDMPPVQKLRDAVYYHFTAAEGQINELLILHQETKHLSRKHGKQIMALRDRYDAALRQIVEEGIADGTFRNLDPKFTAFSIYGIVNWTYFWYTAAPAQSSAADTAAMFCDLIFRGIFSESARKSSLSEAVAVPSQ